MALGLQDPTFTEAELAEIDGLERVIDYELETNYALTMERRIRTQRVTSQRIIDELTHRYKRAGWKEINVELLGDIHSWLFRQ